MVLLLVPVSNPEEPGQYLGNEVCASCHGERYQQHDGSNFDGSWRPASAFPEDLLPLRHTEGTVNYSVEKGEEGLIYSLKLGDRPRQRFPVHSLIGGERFGTSFILEISHIENHQLARTTLVEGRYMLDAHTRKLVLSPGFPEPEPTNYRVAAGRVLSIEHATDCFRCHGGILDSELAKNGATHPQFISTGVSCEKCHGPGAPHLEAMQNGDPRGGIVNPARLSHPEVMELCGQCHTGFNPVVRPRPEDLLISNQVTALANSACYIESDSGLSCISCHDPHRNAPPEEDPSYAAACRKCHGEFVHSQGGPQASDVNCVTCHMPTMDRTFHLKDHWIRVVYPGELDG